jgi:16S rRNA (adenine1518-N6/adenine1519-N6)-dimethyltransferase
MIYKPSELLQFLDSLGIHPKKSLSQNFLIDANIIRKIIKTAHVEPGDMVLEIGSGPGSLTQGLLEAGATVIAVEKDTCLAQALERFKTDGKSLDVFCQDIMEFPIADVLSRYLKPGQKAKVIANLPYHLTTPIIMRIVQMYDHVSKLVLMVQDEVALRIASKPGNHHYSSMTVFLNFYSQPHYEFKVSHHCFYPKPKVESAIISLTLQKPPHVSDEEKFFKLTRTAFKHRRKMLRSSLRELYAPERIMETLSELNVNQLARPEELSLEQFILFFEKLQ